MPPKIRQLKARLRKVGAYQVSQGGSHYGEEVLALLVESALEDGEALPPPRIHAA